MMKRRDFLQIATGALAACSGGPKNPQPNVLFLALDDLNDWVGCLQGHPDVETPNIDRLAARGQLFSEAYCSSPKCNPSRTSILTGRRPSTTGIYDNSHWWRPHLPLVDTLPEYFRRNGYHAAGGGKIFHHTAGFNPPDIWDEYFELRWDDNWDRHGRPEYPFAPAAEPPAGHPLSGLPLFRHEFDWGSLPIEAKQYGDSQTVDWAEEYLGREHEKPFFLAVGLFHPHIPWYAPERFFEKYPADEVELPEAPEDDLDDVPAEGRRLAKAGAETWEVIRKNDKWPEAVAAYLANITFADELVGRLLDALDASGRADDTIVVLFSDHGYHLGEKQHWHKSTLWERATHVPLIVAAPGVTVAGARCEAPVSLVDLYPTLVELCGLPAKEGLDGESLMGLLEAPKSSPGRAAVITYQRNNHAVRQGPWLYVRYHDGGEELYQRDEDPNEWRNLAGDEGYTELKRRLAAYLPAENALEAPVKRAYEFDAAAYTWTRIAE